MYYVAIVTACSDLSLAIHFERNGHFIVCISQAFPEALFVLVKDQHVFLPITPSLEKKTLPANGTCLPPPHHPLRCLKKHPIFRNIQICGL